MDKYQKKVLESYDGGERLPEIEVLGKMRRADFGDGLLFFLVTELSEAEGCDSMEEARRRLDNILREVYEVSGAFPR